MIDLRDTFAIGDTVKIVGSCSYLVEIARDGQKEHSEIPLDTTGKVIQHGIGKNHPRIYCDFGLFGVHAFSLENAPIEFVPPPSVKERFVETLTKLLHKDNARWHIPAVQDIVDEALAMSETRITNDDIPF